MSKMVAPMMLGLLAASLSSDFMKLTQNVLAQPIRLMLHYAGVEFEDKRYPYGPGNDPEAWLKERECLGLDFPNLPYYIDGDIKMTQTNAILRYIGRKYDLYGSNEAEKVLIEMCADQVMDFRNEFVLLIYAFNNINYEEMKPRYLQALPGKLKRFEQYLNNKTWLAGDKISFPDFHLYELLDQHKMFEPDCLKEFPNLMAYCDRFENLPAIKKYKASKDCIRSPVNAPMAKWTG